MLHKACGQILYLKEKDWSGMPAVVLSFTRGYLKLWRSFAPAAGWRFSVGCA
jgi:hypothetical protein